MIATQPLTRLFKSQILPFHHQINRSPMSLAGKAAERIPAHRERQRGMMIVVERAETFMPHNPESKSLCDPLNRKVAELLKF